MTNLIIRTGRLLSEYGLDGRRRSRVAVAVTDIKPLTDLVLRETKQALSRRLGRESLAPLPSSLMCTGQQVNLKKVAEVSRRSLSHLLAVELLTSADVSQHAIKTKRENGEHDLLQSVLLSCRRVTVEKSIGKKIDAVVLILRFLAIGPAFVFNTSQTKTASHLLDLLLAPYSAGLHRHRLRRRVVGRRLTDASLHALRVLQCTASTVDVRHRHGTSVILL